MKLTLKIESTSFTGMVRELARLSGKEFAHVLRLEAAYCIKRAALQSKVASQASIRRMVTERDSARIIRTADGRVLVGRDTKGLGHVELISTNTTRDEGRVWYVDHRGDADQKYMVFDAGPSRGWRLPAQVWARYQALAAEMPGAVKALLADLVGRRGIERQSWIQMADGINVNLAQVAPQGPVQQEVARAANVRGTQFKNGSAFERNAPASFMIEVTNASPTAIRRNGQSRLDSAMASRVEGFGFAMAKGFFDDVQFRARRYPGIFVSQS